LVGRPLPLSVALPSAVGAGAMLDAAFPDRGWWLAALVAVAILLLSLAGRGFATGILVGTAAGGTFWLLHVNWLTLYLGPVPWLALSSLETIFFAVSAGMTAVVLTRASTLFGPFGRLVVVPSVVAGIWTAREAVTGAWPYGGFAWGRLATSQVDGPFRDLLPWVGAAGLTFLLAWLAALSVQLLREYAIPGLARIAAALAAVLLLLSVPGWGTNVDGSARVLAVQGGRDAGLFADYDPGDLLQAHADQTAASPAANVDFIVWPENSSDLDPARSPDAAATLNQIAETAGVPVIAGTITARGDEFFNTSLLWEAGEGVTDWYDKAHPVPFAEYMPDRSFWRPFAPDLVDLVTRDYSIGTRENTFSIGDLVAGISICFDIADDSLITAMIDDGARLILAQTNNADFGRTDESVQQLAIARMRALETSRSLVNISTVGASAVVGPDGSVLQSLPTWQPGTLVAEVPLSSDVTPAIAIGQRIPVVAGVIGLAGFVLAVAAGSRMRTRSPRSSLTGSSAR